MWTAMMRKGGGNDSRLYFGGDKPRTRIEANRLACIFLSRIKLNSSTSKTCPKISNEKKPNSNPLPLNPASKIHHELRTSNPSAHLHLFTLQIVDHSPFSAQMSATDLQNRSHAELSRKVLKWTNSIFSLVEVLG